MSHFALRRTLTAIASAAALVAAASCTKSKSSVTAPTTGALDVTVHAVVGATPSVTVAGPGGYTKAIAATTTLTNLAVGSYTVTAAPVAVPGAIVGSLVAATVAGSPATITAGDSATVTATYAQTGGTGALWVVNNGTGVSMSGYSAAQLTATTALPGATILGDAQVSVRGAAFDANGNIWLANLGGNTVSEYTTSQLDSSATPAPAVVLSSAAGALNQPWGIAFDASGNLWIANFGGGTLVEFAASQLGASGAPTATVIISSVSNSVKNPRGIAFDASGDLWITNNNNTLAEFTPSQLMASGAPVPTVTISAVAQSIVGPIGIAFDAAGNLWVSNGNTGFNTISGFAPSQLTVSGAPVPTTTLSATAGSFNQPSGMAFDASGDLWVSNQGNSTVVEIAASLVGVTGSPVPATILSGSSLVQPVSLAFSPHATGLPIKP